MLEKEDNFPPSYLALEEPNGLLAVGGDLSPQRLIQAYTRGIFPWYEAGQPILWWTPDPRMVLFPSEVQCSRSMRKHLRKSAWCVRIDQDFAAVIRHCAGQRANTSGTWITAEMQEAFVRLHHLGVAHSIEVYSNSDPSNSELIGGMYGLALGKIFFGESMFSLATNASKVAFITFARWLHNEQFALLDCQVSSPHLSSLGAREITRPAFESALKTHTGATSLRAGQALWQQAASSIVTPDGYLVD